MFDACVLFPFALRDVLVQLATTELFLGRWTREIHEEWITAVLAQHPQIRREQLVRTRDLMDRNVTGCLVTGYEQLIEGLDLPDPKDRHVVAAAVRCSAQVIVTRNLKDFPATTLARFGIEAQHPDDFLCGLMDLSPGTVCAAVKACRSILKYPPMDVEEYLTMLERQELSGLVAELRPYAQLL